MSSHWPCWVAAASSAPGSSAGPYSIPHVTTETGFVVRRQDDTHRVEDELYVGQTRITDGGMRVVVKHVGSMCLLENRPRRGTIIAFYWSRDVVRDFTRPADDNE